MGYVVGFFAIVCVAALISETYGNRHERLMLEIQKKGSNVYV